MLAERAFYCWGNEIKYSRTVSEKMLINAVAPLAGAWIEIMNWFRKNCIQKSLPSRERGLKFWNVD